jgi:glycosyltransferase involved in cell wall biosynthesis
MNLISIIIPIHNREDVLAETINSVLSQTYSNWECILVDDHSTDKSIEICEKYSSQDERIKTYQLPDGKRFASAARNYGLEKSSGDFINFLDSDDILLPEKLELQLKEFKINPHFDVVTCQHALLINENGKKTIRTIYFSPEDIWLEAIWIQNGFDLQGVLWQTNAPLWRRKTIMDLGGFNEKLKYWEDPELNLRAILFGAKIKRLEKVLFYLRRENHSHLTEKDHITKDPFILEGIMEGWKQLKENGQITDFRKKLITLAIYMICVHFKQKRKITKTYFYWIKYTNDIELNFFSQMKGIILLLPYRYPAKKFQDKFREEYFLPLFQLKSIGANNS